MSSDVTRDEFQHLESRVTIVEREVEGEKMVTRHILEQTRRNSDDLAGIKTRLDRVERKVDGLEGKVDSLDRKVESLDQKVDSLERKVDSLDRKVDGLVKDLPTTVGAVMRDILRDRDGRS